MKINLSFHLECDDSCGVSIAEALQKWIASGPQTNSIDMVVSDELNRAGQADSQESLVSEDKNQKPMVKRKSTGKTGRKNPHPDKFPEEWKRIALGLINKHVVFNFKDVAGTKRNHNYFKYFLKWLETQQVEISRDTTKGSHPYVFTPYYYNGRVKVLASNDPKNKIPTKGAGSIRQYFPEQEEEDLILAS